MKKSIGKLKWKRWTAPAAWTREEQVFLPLLLLFLMGVAAGCVAGLFLTPEGGGTALAIFSTDALPGTFWEALWGAGVFFLLLLALSTSWLGLVLVPAAVLLRGYLLSCSVSALYAAASWQGLRYAALVSGIPALVLVPCFLVAARDTADASRRLLELRMGRHGGPPKPAAPGRTIAIGGAVVCAALYSSYLLPGLL